MNVDKYIRKVTGAADVREAGVLQVLWSGYGRIIRYELEGADRESVVVKHVELPNNLTGGLSHKRKLKSYRIESAWYKNWSERCSEACRVPGCLALEAQGDEFLMVLEDIDAAGFPGRRRYVSWEEFEACLSWLAHFHATFMGEVPEGLWKNGTYWHLDTRPDELKALDDLPLRKAAGKIDLKLKKSPFMTFVHGDAKLANFCFSRDGRSIAAVDFQYVGGGCGMKDVAYFVGSCFREAECEQHEAEILDYYFAELKEALAARGRSVDFGVLEADWRELYPVAWADFHRFIKGWADIPWERDGYSERVAREVIRSV